MGLIQLLLLSILLGVVRGNRDIQLHEEVCPTWFIPQVINDSVNCICGVSFEEEAVVCDPNSNRSMLRNDYCMTYEDL